MHSQDGNTVSGGAANFDFGSAAGNRRAGSKSRPIKASMDVSTAAGTGDEGGSARKVQPKGTRFQSKDRQVQMSPKVLETWINETLQDAEHLDIPGVILKPEH
mmetsp:Transcript_35468/g.43396  ORF Transcript_35468/g.43396 Transcript_35468/m.43396 type:complete len:103 (-) Transcript_35468:3653-3961(-)